MTAAIASAVPLYSSTTSLPSGVTYDSKTLTVKLSMGTIEEFYLVDNDVVFKSTMGNIRLANTEDKILSVVDGNGVKATYKVAGNIPDGDGVSYNADGTEVILGENTSFDYSFFIGDYGNDVRTGNATAYKGDYYNLFGSNYDEVLIAGSGNVNLCGGLGNDTLYGGAGKNDFLWDDRYGDDIVYNYTKGQDRIDLSDGRIDSYTVSGNDVILKSGTATLTVKDAKPADIAVYVIDLGELNLDDLNLWNENQYHSSELALKKAELSDVTILDDSGNKVTNWQESATLSEKVASAESASLYFDDEASYVDSDSRRLEAVSQSQAAVASSNYVQDMGALYEENAYASTGTLFAGNVTAVPGVSPIEETAAFSTSNAKSDDSLNHK